MRMDRSRGPTVADLLREVDEADLANVIFELGEERYSRRIARSLVRARDEGALSTTGPLAAAVRRLLDVLVAQHPRPRLRLPRPRSRRRPPNTASPPSQA
jgi:16S rRNA (cytosine1402-N4)-methyltransferase